MVPPSFELSIQFFFTHFSQPPKHCRSFAGISQPLKNGDASEGLSHHLLHLFYIFAIVGE
ncbi:uncharacterized protein G2W53_004292 [Senna tora]|uniref:Uncharacterized protein n=1 Tax=Senna tora TaxID=362788 RepID=A0A835CH53_9FABA|nr:uncharacterized protein G2W53_004292 [Senna tora]